MEHYKQNKILFIIVVICILSRIPQLISDNLLLDGDECVLAIMAKHIYTWRDFPLFYYGQTYGFSIVECLFIIPFYFITGFTTISVKLGMLLLWTTGVLFLYKLFIRINKGYRWLPLLLILVFIWSPAWAVWSMKARGGYLTSFTLTSIVLNVLFGENRSYKTFFLSGVLCFFIYQSQPLWIPGLLPFLFYFLIKEKKVLPLLYFVLPVLILSVLFYFYKQDIIQFGTIPYYLPKGEIVIRLCRIPNFLYYSLHGNYYFHDIQQPNLFCAFYAIAITILVFSLPLIAAYNVVTRRKGTYLFNISTLSILFSLACTILCIYYEPRYLLPVSGYAFISLILLLNYAGIGRNILKISAFVFITAGIISLITFYDFKFSPIREKSLHKALGYLIEKRVNYAYTDNNLFTWQVIFYSNEKVVCRERQLPGRYQKYFREVDSAFYNGAKVGYIVPPMNELDIKFPNFTNIDGYLILIDPPKDKIAENFPKTTR